MLLHITVLLSIYSDSIQGSKVGSVIRCLPPSINILAWLTTLSLEAGCDGLSYIPITKGGYDWRFSKTCYPKNLSVHLCSRFTVISCLKNKIEMNQQTHTLSTLAFRHMCKPYTMHTQSRHLVFQVIQTLLLPFMGYVVYSYLEMCHASCRPWMNYLLRKSRNELLYTCSFSTTSQLHFLFWGLPFLFQPWEWLI